MVAAVRAHRRALPSRQRHEARAVDAAGRHVRARDVAAQRHRRVRPRRADAHRARRHAGREVQAALAAHGQYLPFDPPPGTVGGTVARASPAPAATATAACAISSSALASSTAPGRWWRRRPRRQERRGVRPAAADGRQHGPARRARRGRVQGLPGAGCLGDAGRNRARPPRGAHRHGARRRLRCRHRRPRPRAAGSRLDSGRGSARRARAPPGTSPARARPARRDRRRRRATLWRAPIANVRAVALAPAPSRRSTRGSGGVRRRTRRAARSAGSTGPTTARHGELDGLLSAAGAGAVRLAGPSGPALLGRIPGGAFADRARRGLDPDGRFAVGFLEPALVEA